MSKPSRREFLKAALTAAGATVLADGPLRGGEPSTAGRRFPAPDRFEPFRFVHLTDIHVQPERGAAKGFARALRAVEALKPRPDFILTGGDLVFDVLSVGPGRARQLFDLYKRILADETQLPVFNTIGNHDVFGWSRGSGISPQAAGYGKAMYKNFLHLPETYYAFEHKGWRFFCLDNIQPGGDDRYPYRGFLDGAQTDWLKAELDKCDPATPIITCEHIPLMTVTPFGHEHLVAQNEWRLRSSLVCSDAPQRLELLRTRNVRLCLSGHIHERDRVDYRGTTFINDGAVCGAWWRGPHRGVQEGFGIIDCRPDGTFEHQYIDYGWQAAD